MALLSILLAINFTASDEKLWTIWLVLWIVVLVLWIVDWLLAHVHLGRRAP